MALVPSLWSQVIVVWKDTELSICLLGAYVCLFLWHSMRKKVPVKPFWVRFVVLLSFFLFIFYASAVRFNSLPALVPLVWLGILFTLPKWGLARKLLLLVGFLSLNFGLVHLLDQYVFKPKMNTLFQMIQLHDLVGISVRAGTADLIPSYWKEFNPRIDLATLRSAYLPESLNSLWTGDVHQEIVPTASDAAQLDELRAKWWEAIRRFPGAYLQHRWAVFNGLIRIGKADSYYPLHLWKNPDMDGIRDIGDPALRGAFKRYFWTFGNTFLFKGWFYLLLALLIMAAIIKRPDRNGEGSKASLYLALSAFLYGGGYFFYGPASDFRFLYPTVILVFLSIVMFLSSTNRSDPLDGDR